MSKSKKHISDKDIYKHAILYRIHQDNLRWKLFIAALAYSFALKLSNNLTIAAVVSLNLIGIFYSLIITIENYYYVLFKKYVDNCEKK